MGRHGSHASVQGARPGGADDLAGRLGRAGRLTAGWHESDGPATLGQHVERFGPVPWHSSGRSGQLTQDITAAGLTGRGGAAFPTGQKMHAVMTRRGRPVVVANGMESEPASEKDTALLARSPHLVLDGAVLAATAVGAAVVHLCLPRNKEWLIDIVVRAIAERVSAGSGPVPVIVHDLPPNYVSSEETSLVHWLNGGDARPTAVPPRPYQKGVGGNPTLLDNVETLANVALIARFGAAWYRQAGRAAGTAGSMLTTISGAVADPGVYEIEVGTPIGEVLALAGIVPGVRSLLIGGYFGTWHDSRDVAHLPMAPAALRQVGAGPGAGVLVALPPQACGLAETARVLGWLAGQNAGQCGPCIYGLPAIAEDFAQLASGRLRGEVLGRLDRRLGTVLGRGACRHPDGAVRLAKSALAAFAADLRAHTSRRTCLHARNGRAQAVLPIPGEPAAQVWQ